MQSGTFVVYEPYPRGSYTYRTTPIKNSDVNVYWSRKMSYDTPFPFYLRNRDKGGAVGKISRNMLSEGNVTSPLGYTEESYRISGLRRKIWKDPSPGAFDSLEGDAVLLPAGPAGVHSRMKALPMAGDPFGISFQERARALGTSAIADGLPYQEIFNSVTFIGELFPATKLGSIEVPKIPASQLRAALRHPDRKIKDVLGAAASEWLNLNFGWMPLVGDLASFLEATHKSATDLIKFEERKNKKFPFSFETINETIPVMSSWSESPTGSYSGDFTRSNIVTVSGSMTRTARTSGRFQYVTPSQVMPRSASDAQKWIEQMDYLYGIRPGVDDLWNLLPFSWLVDWQSNAGDVFTNMAHIGRDGLVLRRAFTVLHVSYDVEVKNSSLHRDESIPPMHMRGHFKVRHRASPYGFGIIPQDLSPKQWSILAALGISFTT